MITIIYHFSLDNAHDSDILNLIAEALPLFIAI